jgi:hypothetical protein
MKGLKSIYVTDFGVMSLPVGKLEKEAAATQRAFWKYHADDMVGVPEVVVDNAIVLQTMNAKARRLWVKGKDIK